MKNERDARREADEAAEEVRRREEQWLNVQRQWQRERSEWQEEKDRLLQQLQAYQVEQQTAGDLRNRLVLTHAELEELKKHTSRSDTLTARWQYCQRC